MPEGDSVSSGFNQLIQGKLSTVEGSRCAPGPGLQSKKKSWWSLGGRGVTLSGEVLPCRRTPTARQKGTAAGTSGGSVGTVFPWEWYRPCVGYFTNPVML